jgi:pyruvate/2-oxoglutarate dehydrogenase complex dihydrolipoamide dehydrogenase (E3) component
MPCLPRESFDQDCKDRAGSHVHCFRARRYDWGKVIKRSRNVADKNAEGIEYLFKKNKVDYILGEASLERAGVEIGRRLMNIVFGDDSRGILPVIRQ